MEQSVLPQPGDIIGGKYRIEGVIGQGGMGVVFEASHCVTRKRFAIKRLLSEPTPSGDSVTRFVREAQVAGLCEHRNIVEVYDIDREGSTLFMVMELLKGDSLADRVDRDGPLSYPEACRLLVPCIEAIGEAHAAGIIHRDLKPANIFICRARGREPEIAKVLDFGVSRFAVPAEGPSIARTKSGAIVGTPFYMAPEQLRGQAIDPRVDVYSMGVTLYEVLSGMRPYDASSYGDLLFRIAQGKPPSLSHTVADLPVRLSGIVERAMAMEPDARFSSMDELARALEPFAAHTPAAATYVLPRPQAGKPLGNTPWVAEAAQFGPDGRRARRRSLWMALGGGAALITGLTAFALWRGSTEPQQWIRSGGPEAFRPFDPSPPSAAGAPDGPSFPLADAQTAEVEREAPHLLDAGAPLPLTPVSTPAPHPSRRRERLQNNDVSAPAPDGADEAERAARRRPGEVRAPARNRAPATLNRGDF